MEREGTRRIINRLKNNTLITAYVHDKDAKTTKDFKDFWNIREYIDPNHSGKAFSRSVASANKGNMKGVRKGSLSGIGQKLRKFQTQIVYMNVSMERKQFLWENVINHFNGNHTYCTHKPYKTKAIEKKHLTKWAKNITISKNTSLINFLNKTLKYITKCNITYRTQQNEAFHALKSQIISKNIAWGRSFAARMAIAVIRWNHPDNYIEIITKGLGMDEIGNDLQGLLATKLKKRDYVRIWKDINHDKVLNQKKNKGLKNLK